MTICTCYTRRNTERDFMKKDKKSSMFAKGMALFLALLMISSVVFAVIAYVQAA